MIRKTIKVNPYPGSKYSLQEIYQKVATKFSFVSSPRNGNVQCFTSVKCRDFLSDALIAKFSKECNPIYGFDYDPKKDPPLDLGKMRILCEYVDQENNPDKVNKQIDFVVSLLNDLEGLAGAKTKTKCYNVDENALKTNWVNVNGHAKLFVGPSMWMKHTVLMSLYSLFLRYITEINIPNENIKALPLERKLDIFHKSVTTGRAEHSSRDDGAFFIKKNVLFIVNKINEIIWTKENIKEIYGKVSGANKGRMRAFHNCSGFRSLCIGICFDDKLKPLAEELAKVN